VDLVEDEEEDWRALHDLFVFFGMDEYLRSAFWDGFFHLVLISLHELIGLSLG
jgi:hypothetical protein